MADDAKSVAEQVQEISERWNPKPTSEGVHAYIGEPVPDGDTRATNSGSDTRPGSPLSSKVDAQRMDLYGDDLDDGDADEKDLDDMTKEELQAAAERRGLAKSGSKDDLKDRIREHDEADEDDEEDEE